MWSAIAGAVGAGIGAAGSLGSGLLNAGVQYATSKSLAKYNYELGQRSLLNSPGNYKKGLEKAGINPILASGSPVGSTQGSSGVNPNMDIAEGSAKGVAAVNSVKQTNSNIEYQQKQGDAVEKQAGAAETTAKANADKAKEEAKYYKELAKTEKQMRPNKIEAEGRKGKNPIANTIEDAGKKIVGLLPSERPDSGVVHSAKSVPADPNKTILKNMSQKEKEKWYLEQIRKNQKHIRSK